MKWSNAARALLLVLPLAGCSGAKGKVAAEGAVAQFHQRLDRGEFAAIYRATSPEFKAASTEQNFTDILAAVHRKLGAVRSSTELGYRFNTFNFKTNVMLTYKTVFAEGDGVERFNYRIDDGKPSLTGYNINSTALITK